MDAAERALLDETVRAAVTAALDAGASVDHVLADLGWVEMLAAEPRDAVAIVFGALGAADATAGVLDDVLVAALGLAPRADLAVLLPAFGTWAPPGAAGGGHGPCEVTGLATARVTGAADLLVVGSTGDPTTGVVVPVAGVEVTPVVGVDPAGGLHRVRVPASLTGATGEVAGTGTWDDAMAAGRRAVGHQVAGATRTMLELARTHALEREQFGRAIARFQAVRHRLAEALVAVEALDAALDAAWDDATPVTAALAKAVAGRTARTVAAQCQQVLAGIGFTTDHAFHRFLKRTMVLEGLLGSADAITLDLGHHLLATRTVPTLIEL